MKTKTPTPSQLHSPLPWIHSIGNHVRADVGGVMKTVATVEPGVFSVAEEIANIGYIVTACNSLPLLRAALEQVANEDTPYIKSKEIARQALAQSGESKV